MHKQSSSVALTQAGGSVHMSPPPKLVHYPLLLEAGMEGGSGPGVFRSLEVTSNINIPARTAPFLSLSFQLIAAESKHPVVCLGALATLGNKQLLGRETPLPDVWSWINEKTPDHRGVRQWFLLVKLKRVSILYLSFWVHVSMSICVTCLCECLCACGNDYTLIMFWLLHFQFQTQKQVVNLGAIQLKLTSIIDSKRRFLNLKVEQIITLPNRPIHYR